MNRATPGRLTRRIVLPVALLLALTACSGSSTEGVSAGATNSSELPRTAIHHTYPQLPQDVSQFVAFADVVVLAAPSGKEAEISRSGPTDKSDPLLPTTIVYSQPFKVERVIKNVSKVNVADSVSVTRSFSDYTGIAIVESSDELQPFDKPLYYLALTAPTTAKSGATTWAVVGGPAGTIPFVAADANSTTADLSSFVVSPPSNATGTVANELDKTTAADVTGYLQDPATAPAPVRSTESADS